MQKIPVNIVADGRDGSKVIMHTAHVPEDETWLVVQAGDLNPNSVAGSGPEIRLGEASIVPSLPRGRNSIAAEVTGTADITLKRNGSLGTDSCVGHVYTVPMPA